MADTPDRAARAHRTPYPRAIATAIGLTAIVALVLLAFSWPAVTAEPRNVSLALTGPEAAVAQVEPMLADKAGDVFDVTTVDDREAAVAGIEEREYAGAVVLGAEPELLTASANGAVNQTVARLAEPLRAALAAQAQQAAAAAAEQQAAQGPAEPGQAGPQAEPDPDGDAPDEPAAAESGASGAEPESPAPGAAAPPAVPALTVTDVVPYSDDDAGGSLLSSAFFPMLIGGMVGGIALSTAVAGALRRVVAAVVYAAVGGVLLVGILQSWFGALQGDFWTNAGAFALALGAISLPVIGFAALFGRPGLAVGPVVMMLFANPISGAQLPARFLPGSWGEIGQWFPPGASATLVREISYFPGVDMTFPWLVLAGWAAGGVVLALAGHFRTAPAADGR